VAQPGTTEKPRLEGLPAATLKLGATPVPTREQLEAIQRYTNGFVDPQSTIDLIVGRPRLWHLLDVPIRIQTGDERILTYSTVGSPTELSLLGSAVGGTVLNLWFGDRNDPKKQTVLSFLVNVLPDPSVKERLERIYKALQDEINTAFPDAYVCLSLVGDKLVVSGEVKDVAEATKIIQIIRANAPGNQQVRNLPLGGVGSQSADIGAGYGGAGGRSLEDYIVQGETNIVNLLHIPGEQQVMLKVTVAEVSRSAARAIGLNFNIANSNGQVVFGQNTGTLVNPNFINGINNAVANNVVNGQGSGTIVNLPILLDNGRISLALEALRTVNLARSLAEPNLVTLNGHPARFLAGGEFPVPVVTGATATGLQGVQFIPFGVQLNFTPYITDKDRIRLQLNAEVSVRDVGTGSNFGTGAVGTTFVPGLTTRNVSTTVEMREGQTLAIGGLLQSNMGAETARVPLLGDIPFGGQLFRSDRIDTSESELVLLVTPELVHPMEKKEVPALPGSDVFEPGDLEFYLLGRLESRREYDYRSPVMHDIDRMAAYRRCELQYFSGPHGHSDGHD
jgi:pilus assembly protein CpaC